MLTQNINKYINKGNKVYLYSFCEHEGDERVIDVLLKKFKNNPNIVDVRFDGDVDKFLNIYIKMEYMICSRFHAMILSTIAKQKMYVLSYSKKIDNVSEDLELNLPIKHFEEIEENMELNLNDFVCVDENTTRNIIKNAKNQENMVKKALT